MKERQFILDKSPVLKSRRLIISENFIRLIERDNIHFTEFSKESLKDFRFGIKMYRGRYIYIGRSYQIFIRNQNNDELKFSKKSIYSIGVKKHHTMFSDIINALYDFYFNDIAKQFYSKFEEGKTFTVCNAIFSKEGLTINVDKIIKEKKILIEWSDVGVNYYRQHFTIYSKSNPADVSKLYYYLDDWNAGVLYVLMKWIVKKDE